jgi:predicted DCC family thiol-disulfide oxidoreductase YuxK
MDQNLKNKGIVLFDGYCNLCSGSVKFILKRDNKDYFRFASLQSEIGMQYLLEHKIPIELNNSVILIENNIVYNKSTASLRIVKKLERGWFLLYCLIIIPKPIRDSIYMIFSKKRFKWFGRRSECFLPSINNKNKFL